MNSHNIVAIVPAAGSGQRMQSALPKQYIKIGQLTILEHTLHKLLALPLVRQIIVVINRDDRYFSTLAVADNPKISVAYGGLTRSASVMAGLLLADDDSWALVHDAARPCVHPADIERLVNTVLVHNQGGILATKITDTIKKSLNQNASSLPQIAQTCDRRQLWAAATPQMFNVKLLKTCMLSAMQRQIELTDEASAIECCGGHPLLVACQRDNIKVTCQEDVPLAKLYLHEQGYIELY